MCTSRREIRLAIISEVILDAEFTKSILIVQAASLRSYFSIFVFVVYDIDTIYRIPSSPAASSCFRETFFVNDYWYAQTHMCFLLSQISEIYGNLQSSVMNDDIDARK